jgi:hypothetical protein
VNFEAITERLEALQRALARRLESQTDAVARWEAEGRGDPPPCRTIEERLSHLHPRRVRLATRPGKGRILLATEDIEKGDVVLAEPELLGSLAPPTGRERPPKRWRLVAAIESLREEDRALVEDLHDAHAARRGRYVAAARTLVERGVDLGAPPEDAARWLGICRTNAFRDRDGGGSGLFPVAAMAAHSCAPSCDRFLGDDRLFFQARHAIARDEEITISYVATTLPAHLRMSALLARYGFRCDCPRCRAALASGEVEESDIDRRAMSLEEAFFEGVRVNASSDGPSSPPP